MARQSDSQCNYVLKCYIILKNFKGKCKICQETFANEEKNFKYHLMQHESAEEQKITRMQKATQFKI